MEIDLCRAPKDLEDLSRTLRSRVCIIGGGIAGLTLARELEAHTTLDLTLLETGGREPLDDPADPFEAELLGTPHVGTGSQRVRAFGGTSHTWGGQLLPLPQDAEWPSSAPLSQCPDPPAMPSDAAAFFTAARQPRPALLTFLPGMVGRLSNFLPFAQRNLARVWGKRLRRSSQVKVVLRATVQELLLAPKGNRVEAVLVRTSDGRELRVEADHFVLAAGTVESCRLLLASGRVKSPGIGNEFGQVGRRFHDHLTCSAAELRGEARATALAQLRPWIFTSSSGKQMLYSLKLEPGSALRMQLGYRPRWLTSQLRSPRERALRSCVTCYGRGSRVA